MINNDARSFDEIVKHTGKAKSTISVHLKDLRECELLEEMTDPCDKRKKLYVMSSRYTACSQKPVLKHYEQTLERFRSTFQGDYELLLSMFNALRCGFEAHGINSRPILRDIGQNIGVNLGEICCSNDPEELLQKMDSFWKKHNLGKLSIISMDPLTISVEDCFECRGIPKIEDNVCTFTEGIFEGILCRNLNTHISFKEIECSGKGDKTCIFKTL